MISTYVVNGPTESFINLEFYPIPGPIDSKYFTFEMMYVEAELKQSVHEY